MSGSTGGDPFNVQVDGWVNKAGLRMQQAYMATVSDVVARLKELTPVRTGYLRSEWIAVPSSDAAGAQGSNNLSFSVQDVRLGQTMIITNNVVYARRVNFGFVGVDKLGRHYDQKGAHFVEKVVAELPQIAQQATQRIVEGGQ